MKGVRVLRALLVGFLVGFAAIGWLRLSAGERTGAHLTRASAMTPGAAVDHVAMPVECRGAHLPVQVLI
jgi:hypothetical protein